MKLQYDKSKYAELSDLGNISIHDDCEYPHCGDDAVIAQIASSQLSANEDVCWYIFFFCDDHAELVDNNSGLLELFSEINK